LRSSHDIVVKEKTDLEKTKREKAKRFWNLLRKKMAELQRDMEATVAALEGLCMDFPTNASVSDFLEWFWMEV
jgi:hypothetical protein